MPLVRIDFNRTQDPQRTRAVADAVHEAIVEVYGIPARDRFQIVTRHEPGEIIAQDAGLGFERSDDVVMIQVFTQAGRDTPTKQTLYSTLAANLAEQGVAGEDVFLGYFENTAADWTFGFGRAQYVTGELETPRS
jgi:hypothetical protein